MKKAKEAAEAAALAAQHAAQQGAVLASSTANKVVAVAKSDETKAFVDDTRRQAVSAAQQGAALAANAAQQGAELATTSAKNVVAVAKSDETKAILEQTRKKALSAVDQSVVAAQLITEKAGTAVSKAAESYAPETTAKVKAGAKKTAQQLEKNAKRAEAKLNPIVANAKVSAQKGMSKMEQKIKDESLKHATKFSMIALDRIGTDVAAAMGDDPDMPNVIRQSIQSTVKDVMKDVKIQMKEALDLAIMDTDVHVKDRIMVDDPRCCKPNCYRWLRAWVLYTMFPHDKSIWKQLKNPIFWLFTIVSVLPWGVSQAWFIIIFLLRDKHDEFQLIDFIVKVKTAGAVSVGLIPTFMGINAYLACAHGTDRPCSKFGPGLTGEESVFGSKFVFDMTFFVVQLLFVWVCAALLNCAKDKGARVEDAAVTAAGDARGRRRFCSWLTYEVVMLVIIIGLTIAAVVMNKDPSMIQTYIFWIKVLYGWLSFPWFILKLPLMFPLILHAHPTAYNVVGNCVPFASKKEREALRDRRNSGNPEENA